MGKNIGIFLPANNIGGPQKLASVLAWDLAREGHRTYLFIPYIPYSFYFFKLKGDLKNLLRWLRLCLHYLRNYVRDDRFAFSDLIKEELSRGQVVVCNILRCPSARQLKDMDCLIVVAIAQIAEVESRFPQEKVLYYFMHPEELSYGARDEMRKIRTSFKGKTVALSPWSASQIKDQVHNIRVTPAVISPYLWDKSVECEATEQRSYDLLFHYSSASTKGGVIGEDNIGMYSRYSFSY